MPDLDHPAAFLHGAGLHLEEVSAGRVTGWIDLGPDHHTPWGIVHGGVYATAVETAASVGASMVAGEYGQIAVGVSNTTNFLRPMVEGRVTVTATPIQTGRTQQLWQVDIVNTDGKLVAIGHLRLQNVDPPGVSA
jgi:1,4-dihydroxy-2-naphthoyl-CoA hydrolase